MYLGLFGLKLAKYGFFLGAMLSTSLPMFRGIEQVYYCEPLDGNLKINSLVAQYRLYHQRRGWCAMVNWYLVYFDWWPS